MHWRRTGPIPVAYFYSRDDNGRICGNLPPLFPLFAVEEGRGRRNVADIAQEGLGEGRSTLVISSASAEPQYNSFVRTYM